MNKKLLLAVVAVILVIGLLAAVYFLTRPESQLGSKEITLQIVHSDGTVKETAYQTEEQFFGRFLVAENIVVDNQDQYGLYLEIVDGEKAVWAENGAFWAIYVDGVSAVTGADSIPLTDGSVYRLEYTLG